MHQPGITSPIVGPRTMGQLLDDLGAADVSITDDDRKRLDDVPPPGHMVAPYDGADFGPHPHRTWRPMAARPEAGTARRLAEKAVVGKRIDTVAIASDRGTARRD